jgi:endoglucanase Acf2
MERWSNRIAVLAGLLVALAAVPARGTGQTKIVPLGAGSYATGEGGIQAPPPDAGVYGPPPAGPGTYSPVAHGPFFKPIPPGGSVPPKLGFPMQTNDWWTSLVWKYAPTDALGTSFQLATFGQQHHPQPLSMQADATGLFIAYPPVQVQTTGEVGFHAPLVGYDLLVSANRAGPRFDDLSVSDYNTWFVSAKFLASGHPEDEVLFTYGRGSPYVFAQYAAGAKPLVTVQASGSPRLWWPSASATPITAATSATPTGNVLGVTARGRNYLLFAAPRATWQLQGYVMTCSAPAGKEVLAVAVLPDGASLDQATVSRFQAFAFSKVVDTGVRWDASRLPKVTAVYSYRTAPLAPGLPVSSSTIFALYPHQYRSPARALVAHAFPASRVYKTVRGDLRLAYGSSFRVEMIFPGVLPLFPKSMWDATQMKTALTNDSYAGGPGAGPVAGESYAYAKWIGRLAALSEIASQNGNTDLANAFQTQLETALTTWFNASSEPGGAGVLKNPQANTTTDKLFYYDPVWGTVIGYPASRNFFPDTELNDHHFHYGYFIRGAAELVRLQKQRNNGQSTFQTGYQDLVNLLVRDIAADNDTFFPFLRCFDPYAGHSWASGSVPFSAGNNQESSSEAMSAWAGLILWGEATGQPAIRDRGIYLYTSEMLAISAYWFNVSGRTWPAGTHTLPKTMTTVWDAKSVYAGFGGDTPAYKFAINWLPMHGGSVYLGSAPGYPAESYASLLAQTGQTGNPTPTWAAYPDIIWMFQALSDSQGALRLRNANPTIAPSGPEPGNSLANTYQWLSWLDGAGPPIPAVASSHPFAVVFTKTVSGKRTNTYVAYNYGSSPINVLFSDRTVLAAGARAYGVLQRAAIP